MFFLQASSGFTWKELLLGGENWAFLGETALRTIIMFLIILVSLRILGKRGVKQLSVFELVVIIGLGSAAGDPMFYKDVGILPAMVVFALIISVYLTITYFIGRNKNFEALVEGKPVCLIKEGMFAVDNFKKEPLGEDEFFAEMRMQGVSQLGQVEQAIIESCGSISIFYYTDEEVKYGLPVMPGTLDRQQDKITEQNYYACVFCGYTKQLLPAAVTICPSCKKTKWVKASNKKRIR
ncbi:MAG: YetF domain-containing protein [Bacteroidota bacterium]